MILTILLLAVFLTAITGSAILLFQLFREREKAFKKVVIPPPAPLPQMVGLSQQIEQAVADQAAKEIAAKIEKDLFRGPDVVDDVLRALNDPRVERLAKDEGATTKEGLDAMFGYYDQKEKEDGWFTLLPEKPKKKRKKAKPRAKKPTRVRRSKKS